MIHLADDDDAVRVVLAEEEHHVQQRRLLAHGQERVALALLCTIADNDTTAGQTVTVTQRSDPVGGTQPATAGRIGWRTVHLRDGDRRE